ncbi:Tol-Pal system protein TolB [Rhodobacteraceae bacterium WD3A24]|nr:Tol-Pal system protein TolB [Rhodobacteraceae bacterium WD3A24]
MTVTRTLALLLALIAAAAFAPIGPARAQSEGPLRIEITEGVIEPMPFAIAPFIAADSSAEDYTGRITRVIANDLASTGLFREIGRDAHIGRVTSLDAPIQYADWRAINAQALIAGRASVSGGRITLGFRLFDVVSGQQMGQGLEFAGDVDDWRRMAHKIADEVYSRITGEEGYFDTRIVFVAETGPAENRTKRIAIMDQDGANLSYLTDGSALVFAPRFSPTGRRILFTSYDSGFPRIVLLDITTMRRQIIGEQEGTMTFAPRFSPDGDTVVYSLSVGGTTDLYSLDLTNGQRRQLTNAPSIATAPSFSPDGRRIVFESDRSGSSQLYIMPAGGGEAERISFGQGRYGTPVWSPRGDLIAFTKQHEGRFHIGVMRVDGSEERLLTASFLDEGPTWAPNGRVIMFTRQNAGGDPALYSVDISGRNLRRVPTETAASDPAWSPSLP